MSASPYHLGRGTSSAAAISWVGPRERKRRASRGLPWRNKAKEEEEEEVNKGENKGRVILLSPLEDEVSSEL